MSKFSMGVEISCLKLAHGYVDFPQNKLPLLLKEVPFAKKMRMVFQYDAAPAHYSCLVTHHLNLTFPERWISHSGHGLWPSRSPDLTAFCGMDEECILRRKSKHKI
jgi:hypothetical protein